MRPWHEPLRRTLAVSARIPSWLEAEVLTDLEEALVSTARAVLAAGGTLALAADPDVASLAASVAAEYAPPPAAETHPERRWQPRLLLFGAFTPDEREDAILAAFARRGVVSLEPGSIDRLLELVDTVGALVVGPVEEAFADLEAFRGRTRRLAAIIPDAEPGRLDRAEVWDLVSEARRGEDERRHEEPELVTPYPFAVQLLVAEWLEEDSDILA